MVLTIGQRSIDPTTHPHPDGPLRRATRLGGSSSPTLAAAHRRSGVGSHDAGELLLWGRSPRRDSRERPLPGWSSLDGGVAVRQQPGGGIAGTGPQRLGRDRVPQTVHADMAEPRPLARASHDPADDPVLLLPERHEGPDRGQKHVPVSGRGTAVAQVVDQRLADVNREREPFVLLALAAHDHLPGPPVEILEQQPRDLAAAQPHPGARSEGEVQRALAPLHAEGWRLRHSLPYRGRGDIDSVAIAPTGIAFAIETKTKTFDVRHLAAVQHMAVWLQRRRRRWCRRGALPVLCVVRARDVEHVRGRRPGRLP